MIHEAYQLDARSKRERQNPAYGDETDSRQAGIHRGFPDCGLDGKLDRAR